MKNPTLKKKKVVLRVIFSSSCVCLVYIYIYIGLLSETPGGFLDKISNQILEESTFVCVRLSIAQEEVWKYKLELDRLLFRT